MEIRNNSTKKDTFQNEHISGIRFDAHLIGLDNAATLVNWGDNRPFFPEKVIVDIKLHRNDQVIPICNSDLMLLSKESNYYNPEYVTAGLEPDNPYSGNHLISDAGAQDEQVQPFSIDFGQTLNLQGKDKLTVEVQALSTSFNSAKVDLNSSVLIANAIAGVGVEEYVPQIIAESIVSDSQSSNFSLGDDISRISLITRAEPSRTTAYTFDHLFTSLYLNSDKRPQKWTAMQLWARRAKLFTNTEEGRRRGVSEIIHDGTELDNVTLYATINQTLNTVGDNFLVYRKMIITKTGLAKAYRMKEKHIAQAERKMMAKADI